MTGNVTVEGKRFRGLHVTSARYYDTYTFKAYRFQPYERARFKRPIVF